jgi:hypothetical protein
MLTQGVRATTTHPSLPLTPGPSPARGEGGRIGADAARPRHEHRVTQDSQADDDGGRGRHFAELGIAPEAGELAV